jgi:bifunctional NMN adenylyltransferase/nudix hydrolase
MNPTFPFDTAVLIGRFQPFHLGHAALLAKALESAPQVVVVLGSSLRARNAKNPFTWEERADMIARTLDPRVRPRLRFVPIRDYYNDRRWSTAVQKEVASGFQEGARIALIGHSKDPSSYYLKLFPDWTFVAAGLQGDYNATIVRKVIFEETEIARISPGLSEWVPSEVQHCLLGWMGSPSFSAMREEYLAIEEGKKIWGTGPFITLDALVSAAGHVLLVRRGRCPGKELWAIPGGFLDGDERLYDGALRELLEETTLDLRDPALGSQLRGSAVFDHPDRSQRGRTITHAYHFELPGSTPPEVKGSDDAADARWIPISSLPLMEDQFFDDHFHILDQFLSIL